jgi:hypothetical protein
LRSRISEGEWGAFFSSGAVVYLPSGTERQTSCLLVTPIERPVAYKQGEESKDKVAATATAAITVAVADADRGTYS